MLKSVAMAVEVSLSLVLPNVTSEDEGDLEAVLVFTSAI